MDAPDQLELEVPPTFAPLTIRIRDGWKDAMKLRRTLEWGRHHPRTEVCVHCFRSFTKKGIARHTRACQPKQK